jgi:enoyl-CoA hydratase/carnithine racemase
MSKIIGRKKLLEMVLTGDMIDAAEAEKLGLVNQVVADDELAAATLKLAAKLTKKSPIALRIGKEGLNRLLDGSYDQNLDGMDDLFASLCATEDAEEGVRAFLRMRKRGCGLSLRSGRPTGRRSNLQGTEFYSVPFFMGWTARIRLPAWRG